MQIATYFFVEQVVVVGDVITEQVCLRSDNQSVRLCTRLEPAGSEAAYDLVDVEQTDVTLSTQLFNPTSGRTAARPPTVWVVDEHLDTAATHLPLHFYSCISITRNLR